MYHKERDKKYRDANKEKMKELRRAYYIRKREEIKKKSLDYYENNKDRVLERTREYTKTDDAKKVAQRYRTTHKDQVKYYQQRYREDNKEQFAMWNKKSYYLDLRRRLYNGAKARSKQKGFVFDLCLSDIIVPDVCPVFGVPFVWGAGINDYSPSLDRIDSSLGYVKGNVAVISTLANKLKSTATPQQLLQIVDYINSENQKTQSPDPKRNS